ncbi:hypothetical protein [Micromonospora vulcania]|uniref:Lantibiotic n=1 Tax=Micromonospora vulcania TaxID=1441873 RepID=A0ABW1H682_9ACTN
MTEHQDFIDDPIGEMDLTDLELQDLNGATSTWTTVFFGSQRTACGTCGILSTGCC